MGSVQSEAWCLSGFMLSWCCGLYLMVSCKILSYPCCLISTWWEGYLRIWLGCHLNSDNTQLYLFMPSWGGYVGYKLFAWNWWSTGWGQKWSNQEKKELRLVRKLTLVCINLFLTGLYSYRFRFLETVLDSTLILDVKVNRRD